MTWLRQVKLCPPSVAVSRGELLRLLAAEESGFASQSRDRRAGDNSLAPPLYPSVFGDYRNTVEQVFCVEDVRKRLRSLVKFIEKTKRPTIYTDFTDSMGEEQEIELPGFDSGHDVERYRDKRQQFLRAHENDPAIHKLRFNERLTRRDLDALEKMTQIGPIGQRADASLVMMQCVLPSPYPPGITQRPLKSASTVNPHASSSDSGT
jgi:hypothetical protein